MKRLHETVLAVRILRSIVKSRPFTFSRNLILNFTERSFSLGGTRWVVHSHPHLLCYGAGHLLRSLSWCLDVTNTYIDTIIQIGPLLERFDLYRSYNNTSNFSCTLVPGFDAEFLRLETIQIYVGMSDFQTNTSLTNLIS